MEHSVLEVIYCCWGGWWCSGAPLPEIIRFCNKFFFHRFTWGMSTSRMFLLLFLSSSLKLLPLLLSRALQLAVLAGNLNLPCLPGLWGDSAPGRLQLGLSWYHDQSQSDSDISSKGQSWNMKASNIQMLRCIDAFFKLPCNEHLTFKQLITKQS